MANKEQTPDCRLGTVGGQAIIEGVMMKNGSRYAVAVRKPNKEIVVAERVHLRLKEEIFVFVCS